MKPLPPEQGAGPLHSFKFTGPHASPAGRFLNTDDTIVIPAAEGGAAAALCALQFPAARQAPPLSISNIRFPDCSEFRLRRPGAGHRILEVSNE